MDVTALVLKSPGDDRIPSVLTQDFHDFLKHSSYRAPRLWETVVSFNEKRDSTSSMACIILWRWGMLFLFLSLPREHGVIGALTFAFNGFNQSGVHVVPDSPWFVDMTGGCNCFYLYNPGYSSSSVAGRFLQPELVQMIDPVTTTVKSWSTTFIYQIQITGSSAIATGPGMAFIIVPDNVTIGAPNDYMGLITVNTSVVDKNYESDNHTFAVELDTRQNLEFDDPNENHSGIDMASMNSNGLTYKPTFTLASASKEVFQQMWIDYYQDNSRLEIYVAIHGHGKPTAPQAAWDGMDLSLLKENMYVGFAGAAGDGSNDLNVIYAWSFSNDGHLAPEIYLAPLGPVPPSPQPPPPPVSAAPPPPVTAARPPPGSTAPGNSSNSHASSVAGKLAGEIIGGLVGGVIFVGILYKLGMAVARRLRFFLSHTGGKNQEGKNFPESLYDAMTKSWKLRLFFKVFFDRRGLRDGLLFPQQLSDELEETEVGVVLVTPDFFTRKWPMVELVAFVESWERPNSTMRRVLPLYYRMTVVQVKDHLDRKVWEKEWTRMSTQGNHPLTVDQCRNAVTKLCLFKGVEYKYGDDGHDKEYIREIVKRVGKIVWEEIWKRNRTRQSVNSSLRGHPPERSGREIELVRR